MVEEGAPLLTQDLRWKMDSSKYMERTHVGFIAIESERSYVVETHLLFRTVLRYWIWDLEQKEKGGVDLMDISVADLPSRTKLPQWDIRTSSVSSVNEPESRAQVRITIFS